MNTHTGFPYRGKGGEAPQHIFGLAADCRLRAHRNGLIGLAVCGVVFGTAVSIATVAGITAMTSDGPEAVVCAYFGGVAVAAAFFMARYIVRYVTDSMRVFTQRNNRNTMLSLQNDRFRSRVRFLTEQNGDLHRLFAERAAGEGRGNTHPSPAKIVEGPWRTS